MNVKYRKNFSQKIGDRDCFSCINCGTLQLWDIYSEIDDKPENFENFKKGNYIHLVSDEEDKVIIKCKNCGKKIKFIYIGI